MLNWSIRLFRVAGIQLAVHSTFLLLLGYMAWEGWTEAVAAHEVGYIGALINSFYIVVFFTCVVLHEFGHALAARWYGIDVPRILLLPIGGMAEFASIPRKPSQEFVIAVAGPAVNFAIIAVLLIFTPFPSEHVGEFFSAFFSRSADPGTEVKMGWWQLLMLMNLLMGCFNLLPVFPMDGGRILRALLATRLPYPQATFAAATVAKMLASVGILLALFWFNPRHYQMAVLFGFIFFAGEAEYRMVQRREKDEQRWRQVLAEYAAASSKPPPVSNATEENPHQR